ncbi:MAG: DUF721 domain-containing protein [Candidatus Omnitrophica bacterium]|nr:DUF721 domain-containing protein [Candidatus Omnitrophota bacterium]MBU1996078.1 DUF721 domain-containing protein [Candidatus Omnitrophota bacterium]MBU4333847.1 DUF721 domain-containing protein [Candidatus Omnitrophota bacterium]
MDNIKDVVNQVIEKISIKQPFDQGKIDRIWRNVLNEQELQHTSLEGVNDGMLSVKVDSPAWLYQMKIKKNRILERLKEELPDIKSVVFRIGKIK